MHVLADVGEIWRRCCVSDCVKIPNFAFGFPGVHGWGRAYAVFMHHVGPLARLFLIKAVRPDDGQRVNRF